MEPELFERTLLSCQCDAMSLAMATALLLHKKNKSYVYEGHNFDQFYVRQYVVVSRVKYVAKVFCKPVDSVAKLNPFDVDDLMTNIHSVVVLKSTTSTTNTSAAKTTGATGEEFILDMSPQQYGIRELFFRPTTTERYVRIMKAKIHRDIKDPLQHLSDMGKSEYPLLQSQFDTTMKIQQNYIKFINNLC